MKTTVLSEIQQEQLNAVKELLTQNDLPNSDIEDSKPYFIGAYDDRVLVGTAGLEIRGTFGLFRSLAVKNAFRNHGIGKVLHDGIVNHAIVMGIKKLFLLTQTADKYFMNIGWQRINRQDAPEEIRKSSEFSSICPDSAICMCLSLPQSKPEEAGALFNAGFNCAQSTFLPFAREFGMLPGDALKLATGFGGGMVSRGETCGAVTGAMMAIGLSRGRKMASDVKAKETTYGLINEFYDEFKKRYGSIICKELLGVDVSSETGRLQANANDLFKTLCPKFVIDAVGITDKILNK